MIYKMKKLYRKLCNWILVKRFPFLQPQCGYGIDMRFWPKGYTYEYENTWLDGIPDVWRKDFGLSLCKELKDEIYRSHLSDYKITQVKEKFGGLRWYDEGGNEATTEIIRKYERRSREICIFCGRPATKVTRGWIRYVCDECYDNIEKWKRRITT